MLMPTFLDSKFIIAKFCLKIKQCIFAQVWTLFKNYVCHLTQENVIMKIMVLPLFFRHRFETHNLEIQIFSVKLKFQLYITDVHIQNIIMY